MDKLKAMVLGATGVVGQQFVIALQNHPWFEISYLVASERSAGKKYSDALKDKRTGSLMWFCKDEPNEKILELEVEDVSKIKLNDVDVIFSAIDSDAAKNIEPNLAKNKPVISTASAFRYEDDVPILIPGINSGHIKIIDYQKKNRGWKGFISTQPNCTTTGLVITLKPLVNNFGVEKVIMTSLQAVSGAGRAGGVLALDIIDNVIPFIQGEESKVQNETLKILGEPETERIRPVKIRVSCTCTRVNVIDGHTESVFVELNRNASIEEVKETFENFRGDSDKLNLPSAPKKMILMNNDPFRPQPRLDRDNDDGMATTIGRIRSDEVFQNGIKYVLVSHNTKMGAAKGAVLSSELLVKKGYI